jgi:hypothetical protein
MSCLFLLQGFAFIKMVDKWIYFLHYHDSTSKNVCRKINYEKRISLNVDSYTMGLVLEDFRELLCYLNKK